MSALTTVFVIAALGYMLGRISFRDVRLGTSGVLIVALIFGHYGYEIPRLVRDMGLVCFVAAVGFIAGPVFFRNFRSQAVKYILLGALVTAIGVLVCVLSILCGFLGEISTPLAIGILMGALTSTPGLAATIEATGSDLASVGYGIAYPFGVVGVVLFVQLVPKLLKIDMSHEALRLEVASAEPVSADLHEVHAMDPLGFFPFSLAIVLGLLLAAVDLPLPGGARFSLGSAGGPMLVGLFFGHYRRCGLLSLDVPGATLKTMREFGLIMFLIGAGTGAGKGFVSILSQHGLSLFLYGLLMTLLPMVVGFFAAYRLLGLGVLNSLGSICGGMTSTPALGTLISVSGTDAVAASYAATYPVALVGVILAAQFISILL